MHYAGGFENSGTELCLGCSQPVPRAQQAQGLPEAEARTHINLPKLSSPPTAKSAALLDPLASLNRESTCRGTGRPGLKCKLHAGMQSSERPKVELQKKYPEHPQNEGGSSPAE